MIVPAGPRVDACHVLTREAFRCVWAVGIFRAVFLCGPAGSAWSRQGRFRSQGDPDLSRPREPRELQTDAPAQVSLTHTHNTITQCCCLPVKQMFPTSLQMFFLITKSQREKAPSEQSVSGGGASLIAVQKQLYTLDISLMSCSCSLVLTVAGVTANCKC